MKNIAILGFGVVGCGVAEVIEMNKDRIEKRLGEKLAVKKILDIREFPESPFAALVTNKKEEVFEDPDISIVVETIVLLMSTLRWLFPPVKLLLLPIKSWCPLMVWN